MSESKAHTNLAELDWANAAESSTYTWSRQDEMYLAKAENGSWAHIDAASGQLLAGRIVANRSAAVVRCGFFVVLFGLNAAMVGAWLTAMLSWALGLLAVGVVTPEFSLAPGALALALVGFIVWRARSLQGWRLLLPSGTRLPAPLNEPFARVATGVIHLPLDEAPRQLLALSAWLFGFASVAQLVSLAFWDVTVVSVATTCASAVGSALFAIDAAKQGRARLGETLKRPQTKSGEKSEETSELGLLITHVTLYAVIGQAIAILAVTFMRPFMPEEMTPYLSLSDPRSVLAMGVDAGVSLALVTSSATRGRRLQVLAGLTVGAIADRWVPVFASTALSLAAVAVVATTQAMGQTIRWRVALRSGLVQGWRFTFAETCGRVVGRIVGIFFFGPTGERLGALLGERVASVVATAKPRPTSAS